jgi:hypothetical protein
MTRFLRALEAEVWSYFHPYAASEPIMDSQPTDGRAKRNIPFEQSLEQFLLDAYTHGQDINGEWQVTVPISDVPDWTVTITKSYSEEDSSYQPTHLEE